MNCTANIIGPDNDKSQNWNLNPCSASFNGVHLLAYYHEQTSKVVLFDFIHQLRYRWRKLFCYDDFEAYLFYTFQSVLWLVDGTRTVVDLKFTTMGNGAPFVPTFFATRKLMSSARCWVTPSGWRWAIFTGVARAPSGWMMWTARAMNPIW